MSQQSSNLDEDSSSSSSDEEFLTRKSNPTKNGTDPIDRESLVRRKLLENFYGKSAIALQQQEGDPNTSVEDTDDDDDILDGPRHQSFDLPPEEDLDSKAFDAEAHTRRHIEESSLQTILETEERLALQVRTLDSTMQTLVYENYSRFIDATDAIRSIGVHVSANEDSLAKLASETLPSMEQRTNRLEEELGTLRDQVAEKLRIKRLLKRLDALLKLPKTLRHEIQLQRYKQASKRFLAAQKILAEHSSGFESLQKIEVECHSIMDSMKEIIHSKLMHWSGAVESGTIEHPRTMNEILECAGTLYLLQDDAKSQNEKESIVEHSISACARSVDRLLDSHLILVQERQFRDPSPLLSGKSTPGFQELIPTDCLDAILEVASLYAMNFGSEQNEHLVQFVNEAFSAFLAHVRSVLLEESSREIPGDTKGNDITQSLSALNQSVEDFVAGLTLPEVGLHASFASGLVGQALEVTEYLVRHRVDQKMSDLRLDILQNCILPYTQNVAKEWKGADGDKKAIPYIIQLGGSMLSDCMQLVDDTIRAIYILSQTEEGEPCTSRDLELLSESVHRSTQDFIVWLSSIFERLAGGEGMVSTVVEPPFDDANTDDLDVAGKDNRINRIYLSNSANNEEMDSLLFSAVGEIETLLDDYQNGEYILALVELCRLAAKSIQENLDQSISNHAGGGRKKGSSLFAGTPSGSLASSYPGSQETFEKSASRILVMYALNCGTSMGSLLCQDLESIGREITQPRPCVLKMLDLAKSAANDCDDIFGAEERGGPLPSLEDPAFSHYGGGSSPISRMSGLQFDIERMFKETVRILPHPSETCRSSGNEILFLAFKVAFRNFLELVRLSSFSRETLNQVKVDTSFLKYILPHYIAKDYVSGGVQVTSSLSSILDEVTSTAEERLAGDSSSDVLSDDAVHAILHNFVGELKMPTSENTFLIT